MVTTGVSGQELSTGSKLSVTSGFLMQPGIGGDVRPLRPMIQR
jgi:hypothetical protein